MILSNKKLAAIRRRAAKRCYESINAAAQDVDHLLDHAASLQYEYEKLKKTTAPSRSPLETQRKQVTKTTFDCYECAHRRTILGDAHTRCGYPDLDGPMSVADVYRNLEIKGDPHGIANGWFCWPFNFDPTWLQRCTGFSPKEA